MKGNAVCENCQEDLKAYADRELPLLRRVAVRRHLPACAACRAELATIERITQTMKHSPIPALSPDVREKLLTAIARTPKSEAAQKAPWRIRPTLAFATSAAVVLVSFFTFNTLFRSAQVQYAPESASVSVGAASRMYAQDYDETLPQRVALDPPALVAGGAPPPGQPMPLGYSKNEATASGVEPIMDGDTSRAITEKKNYRRKDLLRKSPDIRQQLSVVASSTGPVSQVATTTEEAERQVHREASIGVAVDKLEDASDKVETMVKALGGYVASNNLSTDEHGYKSADLVVKVPEKDFEKTLADIGRLGEVVSKNVTGEDITEQLSDANSDEQILVEEVAKVEARLKNENMSEKRTGQKEEELRQVRMQLARTRSRLGLLRKMAALSTLNISLTQKAKKAAIAPPQPGWLNDLKETNRAASLAFQSAVRVPIVLFIWVLAFSPLWIPLILAYRYAAVKAALTKAKPEDTEVSS